ncbi:hypothetical protein CO038_02645 [Candidatus Pacearchaeota archaeon CG_4_9_14_0_2_um_filter_39_13]|nr:matrixin family metalloprotease [Candidatus Pacearchaeota archaeon]OIO44420.1 MAG: hypothetical protein AUJ64_00055 [Candidatus Pacearchaeota archaeon CG1_02_39_14]PJC44644.1 MAG: hypothetical protein CO038_02645 [Candidatus Pacearchaeota archaeon CG_4_9_14_0_2_um_filter_39_13]
MGDKKGGAIGIFFLLFLVAVLGAALYFLYQNLPGEIQELKPINGGSGNENLGGEFFTDSNYSVSRQFYPNMRFPDKEISYHLSPDCDPERESDVLEAFSILEAETVLSFQESQENEAQIRILCSDIAPEPEDEGHFIAGEGGPSEIVNTSLYSVIFTGKMSLFRQDKCETTHVALHEVLHVLGFEHNNNPKSILYPTLDCEQELDQYLIDEINELYSREGLADLKIKEVDATKSGRYLNFKIRVVNQGLKKVNGAKLKVYGDGEIIEFRDSETDRDLPYLNLGEVEVGTTKIFTVDNARLSGRGVEEIVFVVDEDNEIEELFENNNRIKLIVG